jgi:2-polyprenyl-6-methoxyphenol hydroxylase-like FAD-dependent oxidoreductase
MPPFLLLVHNCNMQNYEDYIAIIGAGISGLALGCILKKADIPVIIFEKSTDISEYGAGISISPNGAKVLKYLNLYDEIISISSNPKQADFFSNDKKINSFDVDVITTSRQVLYKSLYKKYISLDGQILFDHKLCDVDFDKSELNFLDCKTYQVRHIAACDGIKSICRNQLDSQKEPIYSGYSVWRAIVEKKQKNTQTFLGPNHHIVTYPISDSKISFVAAIKTSKKYKESWKSIGTYEELRNDLLFSNKDFYSFINEETPLFKWGVYIRPLLKNIKYKNLTLLGDAAHPIVPFIGQGGCLALEDAYIFGNLLIKYDSDINKTQNAYEVLRIKRIKTIANMSLRQGHLNHISNPIIVFLRNFVMQYFPSLAMRSVREKIWNYDLEKEIRNFK